MGNVVQHKQDGLEPVSTGLGKIDLVLESLCGEGCKAVWGVIDNLESGKALPQTDGLNEQELQTLLAELKSVMAVYAGTCGA